MAAAIAEATKNITDQVLSSRRQFKITDPQPVEMDYTPTGEPIEADRFEVMHTVVNDIFHKGDVFSKDQFDKLFPAPTVQSLFTKIDPATRTRVNADIPKDLQGKEIQQRDYTVQQLNRLLKLGAIRPTLREISKDYRRKDEVSELLSLAKPVAPVSPPLPEGSQELKPSKK